LDGEIRIGLGHYYLSGNADFVMGAGRMKINNEGKISSIDAESGHYRPTDSELDATVQLLRDNNLVMIPGLRVKYPDGRVVVIN
jgi:hypothetical protein